MPYAAAVAASRLPEPITIEDDYVRTEAAPAPARHVDRLELDGLIDEYELSARRAEVQASAVTGLRITPSETPLRLVLRWDQRRRPR
jgi:hypothetical protein